MSTMQGVGETAAGWIITMYTLIKAHMAVRNINEEIFFRACYMARFGRDITVGSLNDDIRVFRQSGKVPPYIITYMLAQVGASNHGAASP